MYDYFGVEDLIYTMITVNRDQFIQHENFNQLTIDNDIALIKINPKDHEYPQKMLLNLPTSNPPVGLALTAAGWGSIGYDENENEIRSKNLNKAEIPVIDEDTCYEWLQITKKITFCAGYEAGGIDTCTGDSGGPLFRMNNNGVGGTVYGLSSWGFGCAKARHPGVYTNVFYYVDWIYDKIGRDQALQPVEPPKWSLKLTDQLHHIRLTAGSFDSQINHKNDANLCISTDSTSHYLNSIITIEECDDTSLRQKWLYYEDSGKICSYSFYHMGGGKLGNFNLCWAVNTSKPIKANIKLKIISDRTLDRENFIFKYQDGQILNYSEELGFRAVRFVRFSNKIYIDRQVKATFGMVEF